MTPICICKRFFAHVFESAPSRPKRSYLQVGWASGCTRWRPALACSPVVGLGRTGAIAPRRQGRQSGAPDQGRSAQRAVRVQRRRATAAVPRKAGRQVLLVTNTHAPAAEVVQRYKSLADIERGLRALKSETSWRGDFPRGRQLLLMHTGTIPARRRVARPGSAASCHHNGSAVGRVISFNTKG